MKGNRVMGIRGFVLHQVNQTKKLTNILVQCWHNSYQQQIRLQITEELLKEANKKYELLVNNIDDVRATCMHEYQCPVRKLKLK